MVQKNRELLELRQIILEKKKQLSFVQQISWRIREVEKLYPPKSIDIATLENLFDEYDEIYGDLLLWADDLMGYSKTINQKNLLIKSLQGEGGSKNGK